MITVFDSFAGAGGFSLGFEQAGFEVIGASEIDEWACETFSYNHPDAKVIHADITQVSNEKIETVIDKQVDILLGGPPCQGFSVANKRNGDPKDPRNSLFEEFIRLGVIFKPRVMIMENVPNIINAKTADNRLVVDIIKVELEKLGYNVYQKILQATDFGVPQIRRRFFVIASQSALVKPFPEPTHISVEHDVSHLKQCPTLWDAISDLPELEAGQSREEYTSFPQNEYQKLMRQKNKSIYNHIAMRHSKRVIERFKIMTWGQKGDELPEEHRPIKRNSDGVRAEKGYSQNNRRMFPHKPCHTLPASFYANFVHPHQHRNFTPREGARIQSFPDTYVFKGKPTVVSQKLLEREGRTAEKHLCQYNQIGNAVPPLLARAIAENLKKQL